MEKEIAALSEKLDEAIRKMELSHTSISDTSSNMWAELRLVKARQEEVYNREQEANSRLEGLIGDLRSEMQPVIDTYRAFVKGKQLIVGLGSVVLAIGAIGAGVIYIVKKAVGA